jgi:hypothetical protein
LYFAEHEPIAKSYREALTKGAQNMRIDGGQFHDFYNSTDPEKNLKAKIALNMLHGRNINDAIDWQFQQTTGKLSSKRLLPEDEPILLEDLMRLQAFKKKPPVIEKNPGHMYEVRINAHPNHFLDWDKALWEQPEAIRRLAGWSPEHEQKYYDWQKNDTDNLLAALEGTGDHTPTKQPIRPQGSLPMSMKGSDIYEHIKNKFGATDWPVDADAQTRATYRNGAAHRASQHLLEHGIKGIKYLDATSRGASENPTRNYVVFDDKLVNVKRKYAKGGKVEDHVYHGTAHSLLPFIAKNGLDPEASQGMTFFHKNPEESRRYAESAPNQMLGAKRKGALLRVHLSKLPTDALQPLSYSDITGTSETIPPQHIEHEQPDGSWSPLSGKAHGGSVDEYPLDPDADEHKHSGGHMTWMFPDSFLDKAQEMRGNSDDKDAIEHFEKRIKKGDKLNPLALYPKGGQDGRHRATAAKHEGIKKIPVVQWEKKRGGGSIVDRALMLTSKKA